MTLKYLKSLSILTVFFISLGAYASHELPMEEVSSSLNNTAVRGLRRLILNPDENESTQDLSRYSIHGQVITSFKKGNFKMRMRSFGTLIGPSHVLVAADTLYKHSIELQDKNKPFIFTMNKWAKTAVFIPAFKESGAIHNDDSSAQYVQYNGHVILCPAQWLHQSDKQHGYGLIRLDQPIGDQIGFATLQDLTDKDLKLPITFKAVGIRHTVYPHYRDQLIMRPCMVENINADHVFFTAPEFNLPFIPDEEGEIKHETLLADQELESIIINDSNTIIGFKLAEAYEPIPAQERRAIKVSASMIEQIQQWCNGSYQSQSVEDQINYKTYKHYATLPYHPEIQAQFDLAECYWNGIGVTQNKDKATEWYFRLSKQKSINTEILSKSNERLGEDYFKTQKDLKKSYGFYQNVKTPQSFYRMGQIKERQDKLEKAKKYDQQARDQGHSKAPYRLWVLKGRKDQDLELLKLSVARGYHVAAHELQFRIGRMFFEHARTQPSEQQAQSLKSQGIEYFKKAANNGHFQSLIEIVAYYQQSKDHQQFIEWVNKLANYPLKEKDSAYQDKQQYITEAYRALAHDNYNKKDYIESAKWYQKAAQHNNVNALYNLGHFAEEGLIDGNKDLKKASAYYKQAADLGDVDAMYNIGLFYEQGKFYEDDKGPVQDFTKALEYHEKAANLDHALSQGNLGNLYFNSCGTPENNSQEENYKTAFKWFKKAADQNDKIGQFRLGICYEEGYGVEKDMNKAQKYYKLAAKQGLDVEKLKLAVM